MKMDAPIRLPKLNTRVRFPSSAPRPITRDDNEGVAKGAALVRRNRHAKRLRRAAQSASFGRLLRDLLAVNDGVAVRCLDADLYVGHEDVVGGRST
jgi:hypothetical protein